MSPAVDQLDARLRDLSPEHLVQFVDVCCHQMSDIATGLAALGVPGADRIRFLAAVTAMAAGHVAKAEKMPPELAEEIHGMFVALTERRQA